MREDRSPIRSGRGRPRDPNQLAKLVVDIATGQVEDKPDAQQADSAKYPAAVSLGRRGGLGRQGTGGAAAMTPERRAEIARKAAAKRWGTKA